MNRTTRAVALACSLVAAVPAASQASPQFQLELAGMIGIAKAADGGYYVLLVNELDNIAEGAHPVLHQPGLEVRCDDFRIASDEAGCRYWPLSEDGKARRVALDHEVGGTYEGWELRFDIPGANATGPVATTSSFDQLIVPMEKVLGNAADAALRREALDAANGRDHALVRLKLAGGTLDAKAAGRGGYSFKNASHSYRQGDAVETLLWSIDYDPNQSTRIDFVDPRNKNVERSFDLQAEDLGNLRITLTNEPDAFDFCAHAPKDSSTPMTHFLGFLDLTAKGAGLPSSELAKLPLPYLDAPTKFCPAMTGYAGRRVNCMAVSFPGVQP